MNIVIKEKKSQSRNKGLKRRIILALSATGLLMTLTGCTGLRTPTGFASTREGLVYSQMTFPSAMQDNCDLSQYIIVKKKVKGTARTHGILGITAFGNGGLQAAIEDALIQAPEAETLINIKVDSTIITTLLLYNQVITRVTGIAVKYKQDTTLTMAAPKANKTYKVDKPIKPIKPIKPTK